MQLLESLRERLLSAGVAPRHVRRYIGELRDHYEDIVRELVAQGSNRATAERAAWARLGDEEQLAQCVLIHPELRSMSARYPGIIYGAGAVLMWVGALALTLILITLLPDAPASQIEPQLTGKPQAIYALCYFFARIFPVLLGIGMFAAAARQRLTSHWPMAGAAIVALLGGTTSVSFVLGNAGGQEGLITMSSSLMPFLLPIPEAFGPMNAPALAEGLGRATLMLAAGLVPYIVWRRRQQLLRVAR